ncbi:MAG: alpha/beta hydrolase-fold protein [Polyangiaceae bacterium]
MFYSQIRRGGPTGTTATFYYPEPNHHIVSVTGSFAGWSLPGVPMKRGPSGWHVEVPLPGPPHGDTEYKFVADDQWLCDPVVLDRASDGRGGFNSVLGGPGRGASLHLKFRAPALDGAERGYAIYLPPSYAYGNVERQFPVLYLLHGALDWELTWLERGGLRAQCDELRASGAIGDFIIVMPRESGDLYRGDGRVVDYVSRDVVGHVDYEFRTEPKARGIDGLSTGGFTSLQLGALEPRIWRSVGSMSGSYDERTFAAIRERAVRGGRRRYLVSCGLGEPCYALCRSVFDELERLGAEPQWAEVEGGHDWPTWSALLGVHLKFHSATFSENQS